MRGQTTAIGELVEEGKINEETLHSMELVTVDSSVSPTSRYAVHTIESLDTHAVYSPEILVSPCINYGRSEACDAIELGIRPELAAFFAMGKIL